MPTPPLHGILRPGSLSSWDTCDRRPISSSFLDPSSCNWAGLVFLGLPPISGGGATSEPLLVGYPIGSGSMAVPSWKWTGRSGNANPAHFCKVFCSHALDHFFSNLHSAPKLDLSASLHLDLISSSGR